MTVYEGGWLIVFVLLAVLEAVTMGLTTIWFAGGALAGFFTALLGGGFLLQLAVFCAVSLVLLIFTRPAVLKLRKGKETPTNADRLIGETGVVKETIDNLAATGLVQVKGQDWTARSETDGVIPADRKVRVCQIDGVKLIVKEEQE